MLIRTQFLVSTRQRHFVFSAVVAFGLSLSALALSPEGLSIAAEYYQKRYDYSQALQLWNEIYRRNPLHSQAVFRLLELKLIQEGRAAATEFVVAHLQKHSDSRGLSREALGVRLRELQETFLTEEGQTFYLQALPKKQHNDCSGAIGLLNQSNLAEKGNLLVLKEKSECERFLGQFDKYYLTLKAAHQLNPLGREIREELVAAHFYFGAYETLLAENLDSGRDGRSPKVRLFVAYALLEKGREAEALSEFRALANEKGWRPEDFSMIQFGLGKALLARPQLKEAGIAELRTFLASAKSKKENVSGSLEMPVTEMWDPFKRELKIQEAEKILSENAVDARAG